jgi:hypothetical protein
MYLSRVNIKYNSSYDFAAYSYTSSVLFKGPLNNCPLITIVSDFLSLQISRYEVRWPYSATYAFEAGKHTGLQKAEETVKTGGRKWKCSDFENIFCWVGLMGFRMSEVTLPPPSPSPSHSPSSPKPLHIKNCPKRFCLFADRKAKGQDKETKETGKGRTGDRRDRQKCRQKAERRRQVKQLKRNNSKRKEERQERIKETQDALRIG